MVNKKKLVAGATIIAASLTASQATVASADTKNSQLHTKKLALRMKKVKNPADSSQMALANAMIVSEKSLARNISKEYARGNYSAVLELYKRYEKYIKGLKKAELTDRANTEIAHIKNLHDLAKQHNKKKHKGLVTLDFSRELPTGNYKFKCSGMVLNVEIVHKGLQTYLIKYYTKGVPLNRDVFDQSLRGKNVRVIQAVIAAMKSQKTDLSAWLNKNT